MKLFECECEGEDFNDVDLKIYEELNKLWDKNPDGIPFDSEGLLRGRFTVKVLWEEI